jgi:hypothetical protein
VAGIGVEVHEPNMASREAYVSPDSDMHLNRPTAAASLRTREIGP